MFVRVFVLLFYFCWKFSILSPLNFSCFSKLSCASCERRGEEWRRTIFPVVIGKCSDVASRMRHPLDVNVLFLLWWEALSISQFPRKLPAPRAVWLQRMFSLFIPAPNVISIIDDAFIVALSGCFKSFFLTLQSLALQRWLIKSGKIRGWQRMANDLACLISSGSL